MADYPLLCSTGSGGPRLSRQLLRVGQQKHSTMNLEPQGIVGGGPHQGTHEERQASPYRAGYCWFLWEHASGLTVLGSHHCSAPLPVSASHPPWARSTQEPPRCSLRNHRSRRCSSICLYPFLSGFLSTILVQHFPKPLSSSINHYYGGLFSSNGFITKLIA